MITPDRETELYDLFWSESDDPDTQDWRDDLTEEEQKLIDEWDNKYTTAETALCERILALRREAHP